jgi:hypothetical protein
VILEIDTWVWLDEVHRRFGRRVGLAEIPDWVWDATLPPATDAVWLMGVWQRSPYAARRAREVWADQAREVLSDLTAADVPGSPYAVRDYTVDDHLGGDAGLAVAREQLRRRGVRLLLDHVPNHVAVEHPWVAEHPEVVISATTEDRARAPDAFLRVGDRVLACGRDPNLPPWSDVVQLNAFAPPLRRLTIATLRAVADRCDGVRVDMAMLLLDDVVTRTWRERVGAPLAQPFWVEVIEALRKTHPSCHLVAEAYWDRQPDLIAQGFDRCYDKDLTDELLDHDTGAVRHRLLDPEVAAQQRTLRFVENHDEQRALTAFGPTHVRAAAAVTALVPGGLLLFEGQLEGRRVRVPVGIGRRPDEPVDPELRRWYEALLRVRGATDRDRARFVLHPPDAARPGPTPTLAWSWEAADGRTSVAVNLGTMSGEVAVPAACAVAPTDALDGRRLWPLPAPDGVQRFLLAPGEVIVLQG